MIETTLTVDRDEVFEEVKKTSSYTGRKIDEAAAPAEGQETAYDRIRTTDATKEQLERFFSEAASMATTYMQKYITSISDTNNYVVVLSLTDRWDSKLAPSMNKSLFSYFVSFILSRWFKISNKEEADTYMADATAMMDDVMRKIYYRSAPTRQG